MQSPEDHEQVLLVSRLIDIWAEKNLSGEPDWGPLERALPIAWCHGFMWMQRVDHDGIQIELYKHGITRRYLNLDQNARAFRFTGGGYVEIPLSEAIELAFDGIEEMGWTRETSYDDDFVARRCQGLKDAGWTVITAAPPPVVGTSRAADRSL